MWYIYEYEVQYKNITYIKIKIKMKIKVKIFCAQRHDEHSLTRLGPALSLALLLLLRSVKRPPPKWWVRIIGCYRIMDSCCCCSNPATATATTTTAAAILMNNIILKIHNILVFSSDFLWVVVPCSVEHYSAYFGVAVVRNVAIHCIIGSKVNTSLQHEALKSSKVNDNEKKKKRS